MENLYKVMREYGVTIVEACEAIAHMPKIPFSEMDIALIRSNPSLSWFQKRKLVREVRKELKKLKERGENNLWKWYQDSRYLIKNK